MSSPKVHLTYTQLTTMFNREDLFITFPLGIDRNLYLRGIIREKERETFLERKK